MREFFQSVVLYLQGDVLPHSLFFASTSDMEVQQTTPLFLPPLIRERFVRLCCCILFSVFSCERAFVPGRVSEYVLAACFVCCSCCDRWSAAHAQINRPTLMKSGFCLLSNSLSLSASQSPYVFLFCLSHYFTSLSLNQRYAGIQRELCSIATRDAERDGGGGGRCAGCKAKG